MGRKKNRIILELFLSVVALFLNTPANAVVQSINLVSAGEPVANAKISIFNVKGEKVSEVEQETDENGAFTFDFPGVGQYRFVSNDGSINGRVVIEEEGPATLTVTMNRTIWTDPKPDSYSSALEEIRGDTQALYEFFNNFSGTNMEYFDAWNSLNDDEQKAVENIEKEAEERAQGEQEQLDSELEALRGTENEAYMAAFFQHFLFDPNTDLETAYKSHRNTLNELNNDPAQLAAERTYVIHELKFALKEMERQHRLSLLDKKSQLARTRREATRAVRDFVKQAEADGVWTVAENEEYWRLHDIESDAWAYTPEEEAKVAAQQGVRDQVFSEIMMGAQALGGISEEDKRQRQQNADTAELIIDLQNVDLPWLGEVNLTFTGEMAGDLTGDMFHQKELYLEAENVMFAAQLYAERTDITDAQRKAAEDIYRLAYFARFSAEDAIWMDGAVILLGTSADFALLGLGGTIEKLASKISGGIKGLWTKIFKGKIKPSAVPRGTSGIPEPGQAYFDKVAEKGARKAKELGVNAEEIETTVNRATNPMRPEGPGNIGAIRRAVKYLSVNELKVLSEFDQIVQDALDAGVRQPVVDDILARARQTGTIDAFVITARNELALATVSQKNGVILVDLSRESVEAFEGFFGALAKDYHPVSVNINELRYLLRRFKETGSITGTGGRLTQTELETLRQVTRLGDDGCSNLYWYDDVEGGLVHLANEDFMNAAKEVVETVDGQLNDQIRRGFEQAQSVPVDVGAETGPWSPGELDPFGETGPWSPGALDPFGETTPFPPPPGAGGHSTMPPPEFRDSPTELTLPGDDVVFSPPSGSVTVPPPSGSVTLPPPNGSVTMPPSSGSTTLTPPTLGPTQGWTVTPDSGLHLTETIIDPPPNVSPGGQSGLNWFLEWKDGRFLIHLDDPQTESPNMGIHPELLSHATSSITFDGNYILVIDFPEGVPTEKDSWIKQSQNISIVDEDPFRVKKASNDPFFRSKGTWNQAEDDQWAIKRVGFSLEADSAWSKVGKERSEVVVAVIDSGMDWHHPDLTDAILWRNEDEVPGNWIDDDKNGYVDDIIGWNFIAGTNIPWDRDGHGTFISGLIAAKQNNKRGIAGINPHAKIMVLKAVDDFGNTRASYLTEAIVYAADNGARVINMSVGGKKLTKAEQLAINYAHSKGVVIVAAAGNEGENVGNFAPAGFENVLTVTSTDTKDKRTGFSNWGPSVDIAAPGIDVLSLRAHKTDLMMNVPGINYKPGDNVVGKDKRYFRASGTSFSAPIVTATASLLFTKNPKLTNTQVERMILHTAKDIEMPGWDQYTGYGILDARAALKADPDYYVDARITGVAVVQKGGKTYVQVQGYVEANQFKQAWLELGKGDEPTKWKKVVTGIKKPITNGVLGEIKADQFQGSKVWMFRLTAQHKDGSQRQFLFKMNIG